MKRLIFSLIFFFSGAVFADVTSKGDTGFNLVITAEVSASPMEAYNQFLRVDEWWVESHSYFGDRQNFSIEASAGGCFCERSENREVLHMLVTFINPGEEIKMTGGLGPLQMLGIHGGMSWRFEPLDDGGTRIVQTYNVTGYLPGGLNDLADVVDAVQTSQHNALVARLNSR